MIDTKLGKLDQESAPHPVGGNEVSPILAPKPKTSFRNDVGIWRCYLNASPVQKTVRSSLDEQKRHVSVSNERKNILKRLFILLDSAQIELRSDGLFQHNNMEIPLASLLSHGGRMMIKIPPIAHHETNPDKFFHWLVGGKDHIYQASRLDLVFKYKTISQTAEENDCPVFPRLVATHFIEMKDGAVKEMAVRPCFGNVRRLFQDAYKGRHYGMNIGLDTVDNAGKEDGSNGHLYMYWTPPQHKKPGALLIGCEGSEPGKVDNYGNKHSTKAISSERSPTGGNKFRNDAFKYNGINIQTVNGIHIELSASKLKKLMKKNIKDFRTDMLEKNVWQKPLGEDKFSRILGTLFKPQHHGLAGNLVLKKIRPHTTIPTITASKTHR